QAEEAEPLLAQVVSTEVELDAAVPIRQVREDGLPMGTQRHEPAAQPDDRPEPLLQRPLPLGGLERGPRSGRGRADVVPVRERLDAAPPKLIELPVARTDRLTQPLAAAPHLSARRLPLRHRSPQAARAPNSFR